MTAWAVFNSQHHFFLYSTTLQANLLNLAPAPQSTNIIHYKSVTGHHCNADMVHLDPRIRGVFHFWIYLNALTPLSVGMVSICSACILSLSTGQHSDATVLSVTERPLLLSIILVGSVRHSNTTCPEADATGSVWYLSRTFFGPFFIVITVLQAPEAQRKPTCSLTHGFSCI